MERYLEKLMQYSPDGKRLLIAIDGRCGCGKSSLGAELAEKLDGNLFHMDDYYLPFRFRQENWETIPAGNMDLHRFYADVLEPARKGQTIHYRAFSCPLRQYLPEKVFSPCAVNIVEGSYSQHPLLAESYDVKLFITAERKVQEQRLRSREGDHYSAFEKIWIPMEERYFRQFSVEEKANCIIYTDKNPSAWDWRTGKGRW
jgi:uridine kinase